MFQNVVTVIENPHCGVSGVPFINKQTLFSFIIFFIFSFNFHYLPSVVIDNA